MGRHLDFYYGLSLLAAIFAGIYMALRQFGQIQLDQLRFLIMLGVLLLLSGFSFYLSHKKTQNAHKSVNGLMASSFLKLMGGMVLFIVMALTAEDGQVVSMGLTFLGIYLGFGIYEALFAMRSRGVKG
jgi:ACR3 family arsenite efflux pump ArsB